MRFVNHALEIAALIEKLINEKGWSNSKFASEVGVNSTEVSKWLAGNQNFTLRTISKIENALDIDIVKQFSDEELGLVEIDVESRVSEDFSATDLSHLTPKSLEKLPVSTFTNLLFVPTEEFDSEPELQRA